jgi:hypothetical protein
MVQEKEVLLQGAKWAKKNSGRRRQQKKGNEKRIVAPSQKLNE